MMMDVVVTTGAIRCEIVTTNNNQDQPLTGRMPFLLCN